MYIYSETMPSSEAHSLMTSYAMQCIISLLALCLNALLLNTLRQFSVFHDHLRTLIPFRTICMNVTSCFLACAFYSLVRSCVGIYELIYPDFTMSASSPVCPFSSPIPLHFSLLFCVFSFALVMERFYASMNYAHYEEQSVDRIIQYILLLLWIPALSIGLVSLTTLSSHSSLQECASLPENTFLQRNLQYLLAAFFQFIFAAVFVILKKLNRERQTEYIKYNYRSLSTRFQIGENLRTCSLLLPLHALLTSLFIILTFVDWYIHSTGVPTHLQKENLFIVWPLGAFLYALLLITNDAVLRRKTIHIITKICAASNKEKVLAESA